MVVLAIALIMAGIGVIWLATKHTHAGFLATIPVRSLGDNAATLLDATTEHAVFFDAALVVLFCAAEFIGCLLAIQVASDPAVRRSLWFALFSAGAAMFSGLLVDALWVAAANVHHDLHHPAVVRWLLVTAAAASLVKFSATAVAGVIAATGLLLTIARWSESTRPRRTVSDDDLLRPLPVVQSDPPADDPATGTTTDSASSEAAVSTTRWVRGYHIPNVEEVIRDADAAATDTDDPDGTHVTGICLSGGGVRAAAVALGALQSATLRAEFLRARYLVSVSGGGYTAGAFLQALTNCAPGEAPRPTPGWLRRTLQRVGTVARGLLRRERRRVGRQRLATSAPTVDARVIRDPSTVYGAGSAETDHLRRHSSYLASTVGQMSLAVVLLARHLLLNLMMLFVPAGLIGIAFGYFYRYIPVTPLAITRAHVVKHPSLATGSGVVRSGSLWQITWVALAVALALGVLVWLVAQIGVSHTTLLAFSRQLTGTAIATAAFVLGVPALITVAVKLGTSTHATSHPAAATGIGIGATFLVSMVSFISKQRKTITADAQAVLKAAQKAPRGASNLLLVGAFLLVLAAAWLVVLGAFANAVVNSAGASFVRVGAVVLVAYVLAVWSLDITTISLHPFYRRRLAATFATRRVETAGQILAMPYEPGEQTYLHTHGKRPVDRPISSSPSPIAPEFIFAASVTLPNGRTPVGNNRGSYTFSGDWVGGPDVGYISAEKLHELVKPRIQRDLTVQSAVAISGAAIATSVGSQNASWLQTLYTITGVRLGAWLPNPSYIATHYPREGAAVPHGQWATPTVPRIRRVSCLLRELFGLHPFRAPLLQVTDGGFYDNLGLIELFRRRCTRIFCIDASGDTPPTASTLASTLTHAYEELGVTVTFDDPEPWSNLTPGGGAALDPNDPLSTLNARLSSAGVQRATIAYPLASGLAIQEGMPEGVARTGTLYFAKASLWSTLPFPLLTYAYRNTTFPHESTANQWFDDASFAAYSTLGQHLGDAIMTTGTRTQPAELSPSSQPKPAPEPAPGFLGRLRARWTGDQPPGA